MVSLTSLSYVLPVSTYLAISALFICKIETNTNGVDIFKTMHIQADKILLSSIVSLVFIWFVKLIDHLHLVAMDDFYQFFITINCDIQFCIHRALKNTTRVEAKRSCHGISGSARMAFQHSLHLLWYSVVFLLTSSVR